MGKQDDLLLTPKERQKYYYGLGFAYPSSAKWHIEDLLKAQLAKALPIIETRKDKEWQKKLEGERKHASDVVLAAVKQERERILEWLELYAASTDPIPETIAVCGGKARRGVPCRRYRIPDEDLQARFRNPYNCPLDAPKDKEEE